MDATTKIRELERAQTDETEIAATLFRDGDYQAVVAYCRKVCNGELYYLSYSDYDAVLETLGKALLLTGDVEAARDTYRELVRRNQKDTDERQRMAAELEAD